MHACGTPLPTHSDAIMEHLLVPLLVAVLGAPGTIPAPFSVAGVLPSLVQRSWGAAHQPSPAQAEDRCRHGARHFWRFQMLTVNIRALNIYVLMSYYMNLINV